MGVPYRIGRKSLPINPHTRICIGQWLHPDEVASLNLLAFLILVTRRTHRKPPKECMFERVSPHVDLEREDSDGNETPSTRDAYTQVEQNSIEAERELILKVESMRQKYL